MTLMVIGCGSMGSALGRAAVRLLRPGGLVLVDSCADRRDQLAAAVGGAVASVHTTDNWGEFVAACDAVLIAAPWPVNAAVFAGTVDLPIPVVSITRPPLDPARPVPQAVVDRAGPAVTPIGLEPGLTEIVLRHVAGGLDPLEDAEVLCGGLTTQPPEGFPYTALFSVSELPFGQRQAFRLSRGRIRVERRFSDVRAASVPGMPPLESYHDGMVPWLDSIPGLRQAHVHQRTVRWPGFAAAVRTLADAGLLAEHPVDVGDAWVTPKQVVDRVLGEVVRRRPDQAEITHLLVRAVGNRDGRRVHRDVHVHCAAADTPLASGLATLTAVPAVQALRAVEKTPGGWVRPDELFTGAALGELVTALQQFGAHWADTTREVS
ncbi:MAG: saccharopine dehydrogenase C-terminal domain-containing protein [Angustibacter sp.]